MMKNNANFDMSTLWPWNLNTADKPLILEPFIDIFQHILI